MMPLQFSNPAGLSVFATVFPGSNNCTGFQPISAALRIACAANFGIEKLQKRSASENLRLTICESTVGSLVS